MRSMMPWCTPLSHPSSCMLVNHGPLQQSSKEEYKPWKWGATAITTHLIQRPCYQRGSPCQDPAGNRTTQRPSDHCSSGMVMSPVHLVWPKLSCKAQWKGEEDKADRGRGGKTHHRINRPGVWQVPEGNGEQRIMEETGCKIICGAPKTLAVNPFCTK